MSRGWRIVTAGLAGLVFAAGAAGTSLGAIQVVELTAQRVVAGTVVTMQVGMSARIARTDSGALFLIPQDTFDGSPESLPCAEHRGAVEVAQTQWTIGTFEYDGRPFPGVTGEATFTMPRVPVASYLLAESMENEYTGCHVFTSIDVVGELPDTASPLGDLAPGSGQAPPLGLGLVVGAVVIGLRNRFRAGRNSTLA